MSKLVNMKRISLKNNPDINEAAIQAFIFENPEVLGLGNLTAIQREKSYENGGRLDMLLADEDNSRYEVEIQLGATDPSHIIRTIEYWDNERKKYPQHDHCAVIVAEEITGRFMNVISLFNGTIPLIALQISAYKMGESIHIAFTKVLDRVTLGDDEDVAEPTDRVFWEKKSNKSQLKLVDEIFSRISEYATGMELKYNKMYIGLAKDGVARNFVDFKPHKQFVALFIKTRENKLDSLDTGDLNIDYIGRTRQYRVRFKSVQEYDNNKEVLKTLICEARDLFNIE
ncbi:MAG: endonuclease NucS [Lachnospiraceae bacterium]|nr:endonuclease NucS [Lachnospiraceae bacterium]